MWQNPLLTLQVIASWPTPNYVNPVTRGPGVIIWNIVFLILAMVVVVLRLYTRSRITRTFGWDDALIGLAVIPATGLAIGEVVLHTSLGWNRHIWDIELWTSPPGLKITVFNVTCFGLAASLTKGSLVCFYRRLIKLKSGRWASYDYFMIGMLAFIAAFCVSITSLTIFLCSPVYAQWDLFPSYEYHCLDSTQIFFIASITNTIIDLIVTIMPIPIILQLALPMKQKIAIFSIFGIGVITWICAILRCFYIWRGLIESWDASWGAYEIYIVQALEVDLGLLCASLPALRPLFASYFGSETETNSASFKMTEPASKRLRISKTDPSDLSRSRWVTTAFEEINGPTGLDNQFRFNVSQPLPSLQGTDPVLDTSANLAIANGLDFNLDRKANLDLESGRDLNLESNTRILSITSSSARVSEPVDFLCLDDEDQSVVSRPPSSELGNISWFSGQAESTR